MNCEYCGSLIRDGKYVTMDRFVFVSWRVKRSFVCADCCEDMGIIVERFKK